MPIPIIERHHFDSMPQNEFLTMNSAIAPLAQYPFATFLIVNLSRAISATASLWEQGFRI